MVRSIMSMGFTTNAGVFISNPHLRRWGDDVFWRDWLQRCNSFFGAKGHINMDDFHQEFIMWCKLWRPRNKNFNLYMLEGALYQIMVNLSYSFNQDLDLEGLLYSKLCKHMKRGSTFCYAHWEWQRGRWKKMASQGTNLHYNCAIRMLTTLTS